MTTQARHPAFRGHNRYTEIADPKPFALTEDERDCLFHGGYVRVNVSRKLLRLCEEQHARLQAVMADIDVLREFYPALADRLFKSMMRPLG